MKSFRECYILFTLAVLFIANSSMGLFFLPALPAIGATLHSSKASIQLAYPIILFGSSVAYLMIGELADAYGSRKILILQHVIFLISLTICCFANNIVIFLIGVFLQGIASYYALLVKYIKTNLAENTIKLLSLLFIIGTISFPINTSIAGHITHVMNWRYVFGLWILIALICLILILFLPQKTSIKLIKFNYQNYKKNVKFFAFHKDFQKYLVIFGAVGGASSIFYTLTPHIIISDFHLSPNYFGILMFIPTAGLLLGNILDYYLIDRFSSERLIATGKIIAVIGLVLYICLYYFFPTPIVLMSTIAIFMVSIPLIDSNTTIQVMAINMSLAGSALAFLSVGLNAINSVSGILASQQDGETMGIMMLGVLLLGFSANFYLNKRSQKKKNTQ